MKTLIAIKHAHMSTIQTKNLSQFRRSRFYTYVLQILEAQAHRRVAQPSTAVTVGCRQPSAHPPPPPPPLHRPAPQRGSGAAKAVAVRPRELFVREMKGLLTEDGEYIGEVLEEKLTWMRRRGMRRGRPAEVPSSICRMAGAAAVRRCLSCSYEKCAC